MATAAPPIEAFDPVAVIEEQLTRGSRESLLYYLGKVVIACEPEPAPWERVIEDWQIELLVKPLTPAIEHVAGLRSDYDGPRDFWFELPKGHDKTSFIGRLANWAVAFAPKRLYGAIGASSVEQAARLLERASEEAHVNPWLRRRVDYALKTIRGPGGVLQVISSDAPKSSGRIDDLVICDELTFWESRGLWDVLRPGRIKRRNQVFVVITNAGVRGTWQWELREQARTSPLWHFYSSPPGKFLAGWMDSKAIEDLKQSVNPLMRRRVIGNEWVSHTENPILTEDVIVGCMVEKCLWKRGEVPVGYKPGPLYIGMDVGRKHDPSVIALLEQHGESAILRQLRVLRDMPFTEQRAILYAMIELHRKYLKAVRIDKGYAPEIAENAETRYPLLCQGIAMSQMWQAQAAAKIRDRFENRNIIIPPDNELRADLQMVEDVGVTKGGQPIVKSERDKTGHADRFWAIAAALDPMPEKQRSRVGRAPRGRIARI